MNVRSILACFVSWIKSENVFPKYAKEGSVVSASLGLSRYVCPSTINAIEMVKIIEMMSNRVKKVLTCDKKHV